MDLKMKLITLYLLCLLMVVDHTIGLEFKQYCYDPPKLSCAEKHILDCGEGQVITTDIPGFRVDFLKNVNYPECQTGEDKCKNKTTCCININSKAALVQNLVATDNTPLINFIKTECSSKSSCIINYYNTTNSTGSSDLYDFVTYNYGCIPAVKDNITVDFLENISTKFTGNNSPAVYYLDYTGSGTTDNDVILNRECIVTTTEKYIILTIIKLSLQADDCCRFHISGYNIREYCSLSGSFIPSKAKLIGRITATIRLENIVNKDGDSFSILVKAAGNVTIDCREITNVDKPETITCQYPTPESSTINKSTVSPSISTDAVSETSNTKLGIEDKEKKYTESELAGIICGTVAGLVFLNIIVIIIVVLIFRRKLRAKQTTNETQNYSSLNGGLTNSSDHNYAGMETTRGRIQTT